MVSGNVNIDLKLKSYRNDTPLETRILFYSIKRRKLRSLVAQVVALQFRAKRFQRLEDFPTKRVSCTGWDRSSYIHIELCPEPTPNKFLLSCAKMSTYFDCLEKRNDNSSFRVTFAISSLRFIRAGNLISSGKERIEKRCCFAGWRVNNVKMARDFSSTWLLR